MIWPTQAKRSAALLLLFLVALAGCRKEEQAVAKVAQSAENAEHKAQAAATELDHQRAQLARIPLPTKSMYVDVREPGAWVNPFISVDADSLNLRVIMSDANPSLVGQGTMLRPESARRRELDLRLADLTEALIALPDGAWHYGRVVAVAESPQANRKDRPRLRRNVEATIQKLNDLGIVVEEWPTR